MPLAPEVFASLDPLTLAGSRCDSCATVQFPSAPSCAHCARVSPEVIELPRTGRVWTWTVQRFRPKPPFAMPVDEAFAPFVVGYVDLGPVLVASWLLVDPSQVGIGLPVRLVEHTLPGSDAAAYAFRP